ncbi:MAG: hypothetical protein HXS47_05545 [Theionarchaea archaeon]|nr:hypothetical protein [Theionarchaea archaeon]
MVRLSYVIIAVIVLILSSFFGISYYYYAGSHSSTYTYSLDITTNNSLEDVTLFLPLPSDTDSTWIHTDIEDALSIHEDVLYEISETEYGSMLTLVFDSIEPSDPFHVSVDIPTNHEINTKNPLDYEVLLQPKITMTQTECQFPHPDWESLTCFTYHSPLYAQYGASPSTEVSISITLTGRNSWWIFGWSGNEYTDELLLTLTGESFGWTQGSGTLIIGFGNYSPFF